MRKYIVLFFLLVNILIPVSSQAKNSEDLLPYDFLTKGLAENNIAEIIKLNKNTKLSDIIFCDSYLANPLECIASKNDKKGKFLLDFKQRQIFIISNKGEALSDASSVQKIFGYKIIEFISGNLSVHKDLLSNMQKKNYNIEPLNDSVTTSSSITPDYCSGVPEVFPTSCALHDSCYDSGSAKGVCDDGFHLNMKIEAKFLADGDMEVYAALFAARAAYYEGVVHLDEALLAFCLATPGGFPECDTVLFNYLKDNLEHTDDTSGGTFTGDMAFGNIGGLQFGSMGGHTISYTCEVWSFPDGNGGTYLLQRNCTMSYH